MDLLKDLFTGKGAIRRRLVDLAATIMLFAIFYLITVILLGV